MQRFTISLDDSLAELFDRLITDHAYENRSEAVRDLIRERIDRERLDAAPSGDWCVASVSYVYDHHEQTVSERILGLQHEQHDLFVTSMHTHLDHDHCLETTTLRGPTAAVRECAQALIALRGVRHGNIHLVPLSADDHRHVHHHSAKAPHVHFKPLS